SSRNSGNTGIVADRGSLGIVGGPAHGIGQILTASVGEGTDRHQAELSLVSKADSRRKRRRIERRTVSDWIGNGGSANIDSREGSRVHYHRPRTGDRVPGHGVDEAGADKSERAYRSDRFIRRTPSREQT